MEIIGKIKEEVLERIISKFKSIIYVLKPIIAS